MDIKEKIIVALDVESLAKTTPIVSTLAPHVGYFKVGLELLTSSGAPQVVQHIRRLGGKVFFDGKFSDIPNTVGRATRVMTELGVSLFTVHANCGPESLKAAAAEKGAARALAVTVLTSIDAVSCENIFGAVPTQKVAQFARDASETGMDGIVCSGEELEWLSSESRATSLLKVVPGIRPEWARASSSAGQNQDDQKRIVTPAQAIQRGASHIVIGRPILQPPIGVGTPLDAISRLTAEIQAAL